MATNQNSNDMFDGFQAFADEAVPEGAILIQYGLSKQVVQIVAEAEVEPQPAKTLRQIAEEYAKRFNMPVTGLIAFGDGKDQLDLDAPIPTVQVQVVEKEVPGPERIVYRDAPKYQTIEFRQPGNEKGATGSRLVRVVGEPEIIPLNTAETFTVRVYRRDTVEYQVTREEVAGVMSLGLIDLVELKNDLSLLRYENSLAVVGRLIVETKATRPVFTIVANVRQTVGISILAALDGYPGAQVRLNGNDWDPEDEVDTPLHAGDLLELVVTGGTKIGDFASWALQQRVSASIAYDEAVAADEAAIMARKEQLEKLSWVALRRLAVEKGIKAFGKGRKADVIIEDLVAQEFPIFKNETSWTQDWLTSNATEVLES